jgi:hypothetical protein
VVIDLGVVCRFQELKVFFRCKDRTMWASELRLEKSKDPEGPWTAIWHGTDRDNMSKIFATNNVDNWQTFRGFEAYSQYVRLVIVKNHGHPHFMLVSQVRIG